MKLANALATLWNSVPNRAVGELDARGLDLLTVQKLFTNKLKTLSNTTNITALNFALNPTTTMTQATKPNMLTKTLQKLQLPVNTKPMKRNTKRTLPPSCTYIFLSFSSICGNPAKTRLRTQLSDKTIRRPPMTERLRRKKFRSKIRP